jgi:hypothetical protein
MHEAIEYSGRSVLSTSGCDALAEVSPLCADALDAYPTTNGKQNIGNAPQQALPVLGPLIEFGPEPGRRQEKAICHLPLY